LCGGIVVVLGRTATVVATRLAAFRSYVCSINGTRNSKNKWLALAIAANHVTLTAIAAAVIGVLH
jgi:hypothetical protein